MPDRLRLYRVTPVPLDGPPLSPGLYVVLDNQRPIIVQEPTTVADLLRRYADRIDPRVRDVDRAG